MELLLELSTIKPDASGYAHVRLSPFRIEDGRPRYFVVACGENIVSGLDLAGLMISCQIDKHAGDSPSYAWCVEYRDIFSVDMPRAQSMAKTLAAIERRMSKMYDLEGSPKSYGQFVNRVARAIGAAGIQERGREGMMTWTLGESVYPVDQRVQQMKTLCEERAA